MNPTKYRVIDAFADEFNATCVMDKEFNEVGAAIDWAQEWADEIGRTIIVVDLEADLGVSFVYPLVTETQE